MPSKHFRAAQRKHKPGKCSRVGCHAEFIYLRGVCQRCYNQVMHRIHEGYMTWEQAVAQDLIPPLATKRKRRKRRY